MGNVGAGSGSRPATADDLNRELELHRQLGALAVPILQRRDDPHQHLFFAFLDGTGQDLNNPKLGDPTTIGLAFQQAERLERDPGNRLGAHYSKGIGTQSDAIGRAIDGAFAHSYRDGIEKAYLALANRSAVWMRDDPQAEISVVGAGYSRGAVQTPGLLRLVDKYGIANPDSLAFGSDRDGNITVVSELPPLVAPGKVAQAALLLDPVATHMPANYDARLPPSVISRVSILAADERRELFPHQTINDPGITADRLAINATAPGGHSNVGGGNKEPGLEILTGNAAFDYLNQLSDRPLFEKRPVPTDLSSVTVYQAGGATAVFGLKLDNDGQRNLRDELASCKIVDPCRDSEPVDQKLASQFEYRSIPVDAIERAQLQALVQQALQRDMARTAPPRPSPDSPEHPSHSSLLRIREGVQIAERSGQISFASDTEREQFSRSALASMKDSRDISWVDAVVVGTKGYAFLVENGSNAHDQRRVPFDIEQAKHMPLAISDQILERAGQDANLQQDQQRQQGQARDAIEPAMGGMAR
ncbi:DUF2235 domain-containing protein [Stenotrophomonas sp.]|uniref:phospholipase effector Tle1 domain-containing protein n=1 Tax=Stenotrophomonas sp. TaxID=69392 RepID=UPI0028A7C172|nr:DUF2235 domain-containing protein [Stenotrophomonas sp.]